MSAVDIFTANILLAKAEAAGADPERSWPIVAFAPCGPSYRLCTPAIGKFIFSSNWHAITEAALEKMCEIAAPVPCWLNHSESTDSSFIPRLGAIRIIPKNPLSSGGRAGDIYALTWDPHMHAVLAVLEASPEWHELFMAEWLAGDLNQRGFSMEYFGKSYDWKPNSRARESYTVFHEIGGLFSVDLADYPAAAGRFLMPGCEPTYEVQAEADNRFRENTGACILWLDDDDKE